MSSHQSGIDEYPHETVAGQCAIVAALVIALHESGVMPRDSYSDSLLRLWIEMPEDEAVGEAGAVIERVLDLLDANVHWANSSNAAERKPALLGFSGRPVNDDAVARPAPAALKALAQALCGAVRRA